MFTIFYYLVGDYFGCYEKFSTEEKALKSFQKKKGNGYYQSAVLLDTSGKVLNSFSRRKT